MLQCLYSSEARKQFGETLDKIDENQIPVEVKKKVAGRTKDFIFLSKESYLSILDQIKFFVKETREEDGSVTLELESLNLLAWGDSLEEALDDLVEDMVQYAEEYQSDIQMYLNSPNRKSHYLYLLKVWSHNKEEIKAMLHTIGDGSF